jgi:hypothetical protein
MYWSSKQAEPDGYKIGEAIFPALKTGGISSFTRIEGAGDLTASAISARLSEAALSGSSDVTGDLSVISPMAAALSGTGDLAASIQAVSSLAAALSGSGSLSADLSALIPLEAILSGTGSVANTTNLTGLGSLVADLTPFTELSPESLAQAVSNLEIETGYDLKEILRLVSAALAGKLSGGGTSTVTIRDINDTVNRIVATVDANGNRTDVTKDVS